MQIKWYCSWIWASVNEITMAGSVIINVYLHQMWFYYDIWLKLHWQCRTQHRTQHTFNRTQIYNINLIMLNEFTKHVLRLIDHLVYPIFAYCNVQTWMNRWFSVSAAALHLVMNEWPVKQWYYIITLEFKDSTCTWWRRKSIWLIKGN